MIEKLIIVAIALGAGLFVALPLFRGAGGEKEKDAGNGAQSAYLDDLRKLNSKKQHLYAELKDIEFDFDMGKLSRSDYEEMERRYGAEAIAVLKEIDRLELRMTGDEAGAEIESEVAKMRGQVEEG
ncbi:MAG: hypothetical protein IH874_05695 [Candidatus Dadabacteria bacterium]|nr:hypothetical protein [Candidatus Dadabacteria bacterium]